MTRLTVAQALVRFMSVQEVERDGARSRFFAGCFGIFGHGNVAGLGQALHQYRERLRFYPARNEQAMVHMAAGYARQRNRLGTFACTTSVGPGATNMVTGAAAATINRLPVLLLAGDTFATRVPHPVLQQLEVPHDATVSVNDCLRPVSRFYERVARPEQLIPAALEAMRVLVDPVETGTVTLAMPEDVQTEAFDVPPAFLEPRVWTVYRQPPAPEALARAVTLIRSARRPLIVAGGGVIYSEATAELRELVDATGIPVCETQAGRGALVSDHQLSLGAVGATGSAAANRIARDADLVIGVGTRWSDFTTASKSAFQDPGVRFVNINVAGFDAAKQSGLQLIADARVALAALREALHGERVDPEWELRATEQAEAWAGEVARLVSAPPPPGSPPSQAAIIGAINDAAGERGVVVCAAGSAPGDLHKLWRARDPEGKGYHVEYGYSCMGYEIPGGIGVKLAAPERDVFVLIGDGSYLMLPGELVTAVARADPARGRAGRQPWLCVDRGAVAVGGVAGLRHPLPSRARRGDAAGLARRLRAGGPVRVRGAADRPRRQRREPGRAGVPGHHHRRAARRAGARGRRHRPGRDLHRGRPLRRRPQLRGLVGRARRRGGGRGRGARRARGLRASPAGAAQLPRGSR